MVNPDGSETIIDAVNSTVGVTGSGTAADPYVLTATAGDGSETIIDAVNSNVGVAGTGSAGDPYILTVVNPDGSETIIDAVNSTVGVTGSGTAGDPYVLTATAGDGSETIIDAVNSNVGVAGTGTTGDPYILTVVNPDGSETEINGSPTITVAGSGTTADPYVISVLEISGGPGGVIADNSITQGDIANNAVGAAEIDSDAVSSDEIDDLSILDEDIANATITAGKLAPSATDNDVLTTVGGAVVWQAPGAGSTQNASEVPVAATAVNYTPATPDVEAHLAAIDGALATVDENTNIANGDLLFEFGPRNHNLDGNNLIFGNGQVGIGNLSLAPQATLDVGGTGRFEGTVSTFGTRNTAGSLPSNVSYSFLSNSSTGMDLTDTNTLGLITNNIERIRINATGAVGIGTGATINANAALHVNGNVYAENGGFYTLGGFNPAVPDYVFQNYFDGFSNLKADYEFQSLTDIEAFVKEHKHLPGITSAAQAQKDGFWNLSKSNLQNLEKIEELFLHTIEQQKKIDRLSQENQSLKSELDGLKAEVEAIKKALLKN